jgi:hypothetical protein
VNEEFVKMAEICIIPECKSNSDDTQLFNFPSDSKMLDRWIQQLPMFNFADIDFSVAKICESHFNQKDIFEDIESRKILVKNAVPEYFDSIDEIGIDFSCRFCLNKIEGKKIEIDSLIQTYYKNLMQDDLNENIPLNFSCEDCFNAIRNSSFLRKKILENQNKLASVFEEECGEEDYVQIKEELYSSDNENYNEVDNEAHFLLDTSDIKEEVDDNDEDFEPHPKKAKLIKKEPAPSISVKKRTKKLLIKKEKVEGEAKPLGISRQREGHCEFCDKFFGNIYRHKQRNHKKELMEEKQLLMMERKRQSGNTNMKLEVLDKSIVQLNDTETLQIEVVDDAENVQEFDQEIVE